MKYAKEYYKSLKVGDVIKTVSTGNTDDHGVGFVPNVSFGIRKIRVSYSRPGQLIFWGGDTGIYETGILVPKNLNNYEVF